MNKFNIILAGAFALLSPLSSAIRAEDYKVGSLEITQPWSRAVPKGGKVAAGYMTIKNTGTEADKLVGGSSPVSGKFEVHEMTMTKGVMRMRPVPGGVEIKPGETVELKPESFHIMMTGLRQPVEMGKPFKASLMFEKAGSVDVEFAVEAVGARAASKVAPAHDMQHMHH